MTCFDSPIARCEAIHELVLTDETLLECAQEHNCPPERVCPLAGFFTETSGIVDGESALASLAGKRSDFRLPVVGA